MNTTDTAELATTGTGASICADCLTNKLGPRWQANNTLGRLGKGLTTTTKVARCDHCLKQTVVHRIG